jgi:hypothetical protein
VLVGKVQRLLFEEQVQMEAVAEAMEKAHLKRVEEVRAEVCAATDAAVTAEGETIAVQHHKIRKVVIAAVVCCDY